MQQQVIFEQFFNNQPNNIQQQSIKPEFQQNLLVLEMINNWPFVRSLMLKHREGKLQQVDPLENDWISFILNNQIDIESFTKDSFLETYFKNLQN
jgi:hypothetical protein